MLDSSVQIDDEKPMNKLSRPSLSDESKTEDNMSLSSSAEDELRANNQFTTSKFDKKMLLSLLLLNPTILFLRGNSKIKSLVGNQRCTSLDGILMLGYLLVLLLTVIFNSWRFKKYNKTFQIKENTRQLGLGMKQLLKLVSGIFLVSLVGSYISQGSTLVGIFLVEIGMTSFVAGPTSLFMAALSTASNTLIYVLNGSIDLWLALIGGSIILVTSVLTRATIYKYIMRMGKESVLLLFTVLLLIVSIPANLYKVIPTIVQEVKEGKSIFRFEGFCSG